MRSIVLQSPVVSRSNGVLRVAADLVLPQGPQELWFECDAEHADKIAWETCDSFFLIALLIAMRDNLALTVDGQLSSRLYYNVTTYYGELLKNLIADTTKVDIEARSLIRTSWGGTGVYTGFSAGVDSFCTLLEHLGGRTPPEYQVTQLLFNNVGSHGQTDEDPAIFRKRFRRLQKVSERLGLPIFSVSSNMDSLINMKFQLTHTLRNISVALLFQKSCGKFLYSSAVHYRDSYVANTYDMTYADAIGVPLLSTETTECISSGGQHSRFEKIEIISRFAETYESLDVCVAPLMAERTNCSRCPKCLRTQATLDVIGALDRYRNAFDLATYARLKWLYLAKIMVSKEPLEREIAESFGKYDFKPPFAARLAATAFHNPVVKRLIKLVVNPRSLYARWLSRTASRRPAVGPARPGPV
jgi:hypothetical protein